MSYLQPISSPLQTSGVCKATRICKAAVALYRSRQQGYSGKDARMHMMMSLGVILFPAIILWPRHSIS